MSPLVHFFLYFGDYLLTSRNCLDRFHQLSHLGSYLRHFLAEGGLILFQLVHHFFLIAVSVLMVLGSQLVPSVYDQERVDDEFFCFLFEDENDA